MTAWKILFTLALLVFTHISALADDLPAGLTELIRQAEETKVEYPDRTGDLRSMNSYIANGDFNMAAFKAKNIIKQQQALSTSNRSLPAGLTELIRQAEASKVEYPDRTGDLRSMNSYIANGDFNMAAFKAKNIIKQQQNLIFAKKNGLPTELSELIRQVEATKVEYPDRTGDLRSMNSYIANGDFNMAAFKAKNIIKQQQNLR